MDYREKYFKIINDAPFDLGVKELLMQTYCVGYSEGKAAAFKEALELVSYSKPNGKIES